MQIYPITMCRNRHVIIDQTLPVHIPHTAISTTRSYMYHGRTWYVHVHVHVSIYTVYVYVLCSVLHSHGEFPFKFFLCWYTCILWVEFPEFPSWEVSSTSLYKHVRSTRVMRSPYIIMSKGMYIGQVRIKRPIVDTAWYPAHIFKHGYQLISGARRHYMVIMRTGRCTPSIARALLCGARSVLGHVASLTAVAVRETACTYARHIIKLKKDVTQCKIVNLQNLYYFIVILDVRE